MLKEPTPSESISRERDLFWLALIFSTAALVLLLWSRASDPRWLGHLQIDPVVLQTPGVWFLDQATWAAPGNHQYQTRAV
ncbi:MAG: hypothetical protein ACKOLA_01395 [Spartobacteria bacterium]